MGWKFTWVSSSSNHFNRDYHVSFTPEEAKDKVEYNFEMTRFPSTEAPGISVFYKDSRGDIFHTYSAYARGLDVLWNMYQWLDRAPLGRNESSLWLKRHDEYKD
jgi:predicted dithiol-disulfide oxidoreductase (DUF899 family)